MAVYKSTNVRLFNGSIAIIKQQHQQHSLNKNKQKRNFSKTSALMADGLNNARAMRIAEIITQYRSFLQQVAASRVNVPPAQAQARGYILLNQYHQQAQALGAAPFNNNVPNPPANDEQTKRQLLRVMMDAQARRFKAYKLVCNVTCCMRWVNRRAQLLKGAPPGTQHAAALAQIDTTLNQELATFTNQKLFNDLRARDTQAGYWMAEMATLATLLAYINAN